MMDWLRLHKVREQINKAPTNKVNVEEYILFFHDIQSLIREEGFAKHQGQGFS